MMLTGNRAIKKYKDNKYSDITFSAVHDSFWAHPSDLDTLSIYIREEVY
jgi:DNA-directed RNA polymerase